MQLNKIAELDFAKKNKLRVEKKKKRRRTPYLRQPTVKSPHIKAQRRRICVSATVP
jgi:hypothetical protein